jgi:ADP-ribose pyrophosphatase
MNFKIKNSEIKFHGKVFDLRVDNIIYNSGNEGIREVAVHPGGAVVVAVNGNGKIIFVKQYRYPLDKALIELPAGKLEKNEDPIHCAIRELEEETGYSSGKIEKLGSIFTTPGFCTEELHIYLAKDLKPGNHNREEGEFGMQIFELSLDEIEGKIKTAEIKDSKTICGIYMYRNFLSGK